MPIEDSVLAWNPGKEIAWDVIYLIYFKALMPSNELQPDLKMYKKSADPKIHTVGLVIHGG